MITQPALAIGWEFHRRHRWGFAVIGAYFVILAAFRLVLNARGQQIELDDVQTALALIIPLTATFIYFLAVFSFGLSGDLAARQSMFPARLFTLPMTTGQLAAWPMLYGSTAVIAFWAAARLIGVWPADVRIPMIWPALLAASLLAWTQALTWMPYPLRGLRVIAAILWLAAIDTIVILAMHFKAGELTMLALLSPHLPVAYLVARHAVARGRRGDVSDWSRGIRGTGREIRGTASGPLGIRGPRRNDPAPFSSPAAAQAWLEWRRHGRLLPALVAIVLPFEIALLFVFRETPVLVMEATIGILATPAFMAGFVAAASGTNLQGFAGSRPVSSGGLVAALVRTAIRSTAAAWLIVIVAVPLAITLSGTWPLVIDRTGQLQRIFGTPRTVALVVLGCAGCVVWTWKRLVQSFYFGMTGRDWMTKGYAFITLSLLTLVGPALWVAGNRVVIRAVWHALPWILAAFVAAKIALAVWIVRRLFGRRLVRDRTLVIGAACWCATVFSLYALFVWFVDTPYVPHGVLMLIAILAVPLARISAAPLAVAANRHR